MRDGIYGYRCLTSCSNSLSNRAVEFFIVSSHTSRKLFCTDSISGLQLFVLEQLAAKVSVKVLSASEVLAVASYVRMLVFRLAGKIQDLRLLKNIVAKCDSVVTEDIFLPEYSSINKGIRREVSILVRR